MQEEANSWIRRTKFSHTVCHRLDSRRLASISFDLEPPRIAGAKSRPQKAVVDPKPGPVASPIQMNLTTNNHRVVTAPPKTINNRTVTPPPKIIIPDAFKEARSNTKRFSTPHPERVESGKGYEVKKSLHRYSTFIMKSPPRNTSSPLRHINSTRVYDKRKSKKDSSWPKLFDYGAGKVTSVGIADNWMVDLSKLFLGLRFAHGAHSQLYHGIYNDEPVAVKITRVPDDDENGELGVRLEDQFHREISLLSRLHHQNVIKFIAACRQPPVFCVVTEYLLEGSLRAYLHKLEDETIKDKEGLPLGQLIKMALDIARGMEYIHSQGVIHRDLKPENILINEDFQLKIADFGIGCEEAYCDLLADDPGTYRWMAPEMIKRKPYGRKVDVYGFGLILWEMVAGTIPYKDMTPVQAAFAVVHKNLRPTIPTDCPSAMRILIEQCWSSHPEKRPEFWQIVKVLEDFEASVARDGNLNHLQYPICLDHKKGFRHWVQKLSPQNQHNSKPIPKPRFI